jgi:hypothetical protein
VLPLVPPNLPVHPEYFLDEAVPVPPAHCVLVLRQEVLDGVQGTHLRHIDLVPVVLYRVTHPLEIRLAGEYAMGGVICEVAFGTTCCRWMLGLGWIRMASEILDPGGHRVMLGGSCIAIGKGWLLLGV